MNGTNAKQNLMDDLRSAIIYEKGAYSFYKNTIATLKPANEMRILQGIMEEEGEHVRRLEEGYRLIGGKEEINYDPREHGGIVIPPKKRIDNVIVLSIVIKEERDSIKMYEGLVKKHAGSDHSKIFHDLLVSEKGHMEKYSQLYNAIKEGQGVQAEDDDIYRFTKMDVETVTRSLEMEKYALQLFRETAKGVKQLDTVYAFQHISHEENRHIRILELIHHRLVEGIRRHQRPGR